MTELSMYMVKVYNRPFGVTFVAVIARDESRALEEVRERYDRTFLRTPREGDYSIVEWSPLGEGAMAEGYYEE